MIHQKSFSYADLELKKHFLLLLLLKTDVLYNNYLSGNCDTFSFSGCFDGQNLDKSIYLKLIYIFGKENPHFW